MFTLIDRQRWARREYFEHYLTAVPCQYSMTTTVDISGIRRSGRKLYPAMLHALATVINRHEEFRMAFDAEGQLGVHDTLHPSYTIFHQDTETFSSIWTAFDADYETFLQSYQRDLQTWGDVHRLEARPGTPENVFPVSMIPWENFQGFHLHLPKGDRYFFPIFTLGKFREEGGQTLLPVAVQVHHAVCDGFHVCRLLDELRALIDALPSGAHASRPCRSSDRAHGHSFFLRSDIPSLRNRKTSGRRTPWNPFFRKCSGAHRPCSGQTGATLRLPGSAVPWP